MLGRIGCWFGVGTLVCTVMAADRGEHPFESYRGVIDIESMASELRRSLADQETHSFSRGWWTWDRLRCRYVDEGRQDSNAVKILTAAFRGLILDRHERLEAKGQGHLLYLFFTTLDGDKRERFLVVGEQRLRRDVHGGGYHGGWGGAARMRIYEELVRQGALSDDERFRFQQIVHQSLSKVFIDFNRKAQNANNHSFGNAGGVALAIKLFPRTPQATEARAWLNRIWGDLAEFQDWKEWNYYPYGPIFLHGLLDIAEATGRIDSEAALINGIGARCLGFVHGGGVRGNPNSGARVRQVRSLIYEAPWDHGYFAIEQSARDAHFWYRMAQHYRKPEYLWAAEQVSLGGRPASGRVSKEYEDAYRRRFHWFIEQDIHPKAPERGAAIGRLSAGKYRIPERLYLRSGVGVGRPFAGYFLYDKKDEHLDNVSGHLFEYSVDGFKFLHTSGKYNNVYSGQTLRGGGTGEESLDLLLVLHGRHEFPHHPDRQGDQRDFMRRGSIRHVSELARAENNADGDAYGQFGFDEYYGKGSRWVRQSALTRDGVLVVADRFMGGEELADRYLAGPVWHLGVDEGRDGGRRGKAWFDAPALDRAWWQNRVRRVVLILSGGPDEGAELTCDAVRMTHSQDTQPHVTAYGYRPIQSGRWERFVSVFVPYDGNERPEAIVEQVAIEAGGEGEIEVSAFGTSILFRRDDSWAVRRSE